MVMLHYFFEGNNQKMLHKFLLTKTLQNGGTYSRATVSRFLSFSVMDWVDLVIRI